MNWFNKVTYDQCQCFFHVSWSKRPWALQEAREYSAWISFFKAPMCLYDTLCEPSFFLISYFFHFNIIPHVLLRLPSILPPISPPQLSLYFSPTHGTGPTQIILLYSIYTVPSVGTFYCPSSSNKPSHQNTQSHISVRFEKNRRCHTLNSSLTEQTLYPIC